LTRKIKVVALAHGIWYGGAQVSIIEYLRLISKVVDVRVAVCRGANSEFVQGMEASGLDVVEVPSRLVHGRLPNSSGYPDMDVRTIAHTIREADIVWLTDIEYLAAPRVKHIKDIPILAHLHSYSLICPVWIMSYGLHVNCTEPCSPWRFARCKQSSHRYLAKWGFLGERRAQLYQVLDYLKGPMDFVEWPLRKRPIESIDRFIAVSNAVKEMHIAHMPEVRNKISVVYNPVPSLAYRFVNDSLAFNSNPNEGIKIVFGGGDATITKGLHILLEAFKEVARERPNVHVLCTKCKGTAVERYIKKLNLKGIVALGRLTPEEYYRLISKSHSVVVPSIWPEPFGNVALEAQCLGLPVIASSAGGLPEIVQDDVTGILVQPNDCGDLSEGIIRLVDKVNDFDRLKIHHATCRKFNRKIFLSKIMNEFESVLQESSQSEPPSADRVVESEGRNISAEPVVRD